MPNNVLMALDMATVLGFSIGAPGTEPIHGSVSLRTSASHPGTKMCLLIDWLAPMLKEHKPCRVIYEAPLMMMPKNDGKGGGGNAATMGHLIGMAKTVEMLTCRFGIQVVQAASSTARKWFVGHGRPENPKKAVMDECKRRGWEPSDDNDADALCLWDYACGLYFPNDYRRSYRK